MQRVLSMIFGIALVAMIVALVGLCSGCDAPPAPTRPPEAAIPPRPKVPGTLRLTLRERDKDPAARPRVAEIDWKASETAIIVIDMWDDIYCKMAAQRIGVLVPKVNATMTAARSHGVQIIHAPSETVVLYTDTPYRKRIQKAAPAKPPFDISRWCNRDEEREPELPLDVSKSPCDDPVPSAMVRKYTRQHPGIDMAGYDVVSDSGPEIYSYLVQEGIKNVAVMGVHTNMCILGRPFGIRQLVRLGFNVVLVRDLTDSMYDPREKPFVSHARGTELIVEHIERHWCPSILGEDLTKVVPGSDGP